jgi:CheY-like chemotaxis protein
MAARILLCVESVATRKIINQCLAGEHLEIVPVSNAELAQYLLDLVYPDLVIADTSLPDESAHWLCNYIRQNAQFSHLPVVLLVGIENVSEQSSPPPTLSALSETVRKLLQSAGENRTVFFVAESANRHEPDFIGPVHLEDARQKQVELEDYETENLTLVTPETNSLSLALREQPRDEPEHSLAIVPAEQSLAHASPARRGSHRLIVGALVALLLLASVIAIGYLMRPPENSPAEQASTRRAEDARQITPENNPPAINRTNEGEAQPPIDSPETALESAERKPTRAASLARAADNSRTQARKRSSVRPAGQPIAVSRVENARPSAAAQTSPAGTANNNSFRQDESLVTRPRRVDSAKTRADMEPTNGFVEAGKRIGGGIRRIGAGAKTGVAWSGKKVVAGIKFIGRNLKRAFSR